MTTLPARVAAVKAECQRVLELTEQITVGPVEVGNYTGVYSYTNGRERCIVAAYIGDDLPQSEAEANAKWFAASRTALPAAARTTLRAFAVIEERECDEDCATFSTITSDFRPALECTCWKSRALADLCDAWEGKNL